MNDDRYVEYGAATGILFVVLSLIGFAIVIPTPPDLNAPSQEWSSYFLAHHGAHGRIVSNRIAAVGET